MAVQVFLEFLVKVLNSSFRTPFLDFLVLVQLRTRIDLGELDGDRSAFVVRVVALPPCIPHRVG